MPHAAKFSAKNRPKVLTDRPRTWISGFTEAQGTVREPVPTLFSRLVPDLSPLRASRDLRLLLAGRFVTDLGTQAVLVALPYQIYTRTHSAFLTGLLGAVEL